jgi:ribosome-associated heat shock protein Hsp15
MPVRVDAFIWGVRIAKTRSAATALCKAGHVKVNGERAKPATTVVIGDEIVVVAAEVTRIVGVRQLLTKRVSAPLAAAAIDDRTPPPPTRTERAEVGLRDRGAGRPTKRDRRDIEKLLGR